MEEKEVIIDGKKIKVVTKLPKENYETNNLNVYLDDTIDLEEVVGKINDDDKE